MKRHHQHRRNFSLISMERLEPRWTPSFAGLVDIIEPLNPFGFATNAIVYDNGDYAYHFGSAWYENRTGADDSTLVPATSLPATLSSSVSLGVTPAGNTLYRYSRGLASAGAGIARALEEQKPDGTCNIYASMFVECLPFRMSRVGVLTNSDGYFVASGGGQLHVLSPTLSERRSTPLAWTESVERVFDIGEEGDLLVQIGSELRWYNAALADYSVLSTSAGNVHAASVSSDSRVAVFVADTSTNDPTVDKAIFAAIDRGGEVEVLRVHGSSQDGILDPHERWVDADQDGEFDAVHGASSEDLGGVTFIDGANIHVSHHAEAANSGRMQLTFQGAKGLGPGAEGIFRMDVVWESAGSDVQLQVGKPSELLMYSYSPYLATLPGYTGTIAGVWLLAANDQGHFLAFVQLTGNRYFVVRGAAVPRPILVLPGISGTFPTSPEDVTAWFLTRGMAPELLSVDPLSGAYDALIENLTTAGENVGAIGRARVYAATYDWRMAPGPTDGVTDGVVNNPDGSPLTAASIAYPRTSGEYRYGVDYLGYWLKRAAEDWLDRYGRQLDSVDVVAHSTGGLVTRVYMQSAAYGGLYADGKRLPKIDTFVMHNVPNQGAPKAFSFLNDDWSIDKSIVYPILLRGIMYLSFRKMLDNASGIEGADGDITLEGLLTGLDMSPGEFRAAYRTSLNPFTQEDPRVVEVRRRFIRALVPTIQTLGPTDAEFLVHGGAGSASLARLAELENKLLIDMNVPLSPPGSLFTANRFTYHEVVRNVVNIYGVGDSTIVRQVERRGTLIANPFTDPLLLKFDEVVPNYPNDGELYWDPERSGEDGQPERYQSGDGTVPQYSMAEQFVNDWRVVMREFATETAAITPRLSPVSRVAEEGSKVDHVGILSNPQVQQQLLSDLNLPLARHQLSTETGLDLGQISEYLLDPVGALVIDAEGRRFGYSPTAGLLTEIPGSRLVGGADAIGLLPGLEPGWRVEFTGMGGNYHFQFAGGEGLQQTGLTLSGYLEAGQQLSIEIPPPRDLLRYDPPEARGETATTPVDRAVSLPVLANDIAFASPIVPATLEITVPPQQGTLAVDAAAGVVIYTPHVGFVGHDAFQYRVAAVSGAWSNAAEVRITVGNPLPWHNGAKPADVDGDGFISPLDALLVINTLNAIGPRTLEGAEDPPPPYYDVSGDGLVSPLDALLIINLLNQGGAGEPAPVATPALPRAENVDELFAGNTWWEWDDQSSASAKRKGAYFLPAHRRLKALG